MTQQDPKCVEMPIRFSCSKLWRIQQNYFATKGIEAWKDEVPFYISSNAFIGHRYALLVVQYIKDWRRLHPQSREHCFYIMETGSGTGTFSFYFLKAIKELLSTYHLNDQKFCYIITDIIQANIDFCRHNPSLAPFIENGELDFACFNVSDDQDLTLQLSNKKFSSFHSENPFIVIANYTFDCIKQDVFSYVDEKFYEIRLGLRSRYNNFDEKKARYLSDLRLDFEESQIDIAHFYDNPSLNEILQEYKDYFKEKSAKIMMPIGALQFFDHVKSLNQNFFMIVGDKGVALPERIPFFTNNQLASFDGCYSFMVNFDAMGRYLKKMGGDFLPTQKASDFKVNLYSLGATFDELVETKGCFLTQLECAGPDEYSTLFGEYVANNYRFSIRGLLSFLKLSEWDPDAYVIIHDRLIELFPTANAQLQAEIDNDLAKVQSHIYQINIGDDVYNLLGIYYQRKGMDDKALEMYHLSIKVFPNKAASYNNMAIIYEKQKNIPKALLHYQKSYALDKNNVDAKRKSLILSGKPTYAYVAPILKGLFVVSLLVALIYFIQNK